MNQKTAAELQLEALRQLRAEKSGKPSASIPAEKIKVREIKTRESGVRIAPPIGEVEKAACELAEVVDESEGAVARPRSSARKRQQMEIQMDARLWKQLNARIRESREFKRRQDLWDWAATLVMAFPPGAHQLSDESLEDLFRKIRHWLAARGISK